MKITLISFLFFCSLLAKASLDEVETRQVFTDFNQEAGGYLLGLKQGPLTLHLNWQHGPLDAGYGATPKISRTGAWGILLAGWVPQFIEMDRDGMYFVICHELGHLMRMKSEIHADYYAIQTCLPAVWKKNDKIRITHAVQVGMELRKWYWNNYSRHQDVECYEKNILNALNNGPFKDCDEL